MKYLKNLKVVAILLGLAAVMFSNYASAKYENSVVSILVTKQSNDVSSPWQNKQISQQSCLGVLVRDGLFVTSAYALSDAVFVEVRKFGSQKKYEAKVVFVDYEANLAVVAPKDKNVITGMKRIEVGGEIGVDEEAGVYVAKDVYQLTRHPVRLNEVTVEGSLTGAYNFVKYKFKVQQSGMGWAEPVIKGGKLIAITSGQDKQHLIAIPSVMIKHFLNDDFGAKYRGFPSVGIKLNPLVSPNMRRMLGVSEEGGGVRVARVYPGSPFGSKLFKNDVIVAINGNNISDYGFFQHKLWGKIHSIYLLNSLYGGDKLSLKVIRKGKPLVVEGNVLRQKTSQSKIPSNAYDKPVEHLVFGGVVIQELTVPYLKIWGSDWSSYAPFDLLYQYNYENEPYYGDVKDRRYLLLSRVLAAKFNAGYERHTHQVIAAVNGQKVESIAELRNALKKHAIEKNGKKYARFVFVRDGGEIILGYEGINEVHKKIAVTYEIKTPESFYSEAM